MVWQEAGVQRELFHKGLLVAVLVNPCFYQVTRLFITERIVSRTSLLTNLSLLLPVGGRGRDWPRDSVGT